MIDRSTCSLRQEVRSRGSESSARAEPGNSSAARELPKGYRWVCVQKDRAGAAGRTAGKVEERWAEEWERKGELGICAPLLPFKTEKLALKVCFSALPLTSVINGRKSHGRHTGKTHSQLVSLSCRGFFFFFFLPC